MFSRNTGVSLNRDGAIKMCTNLIVTTLARSYILYTQQNYTLLRLTFIHFYVYNQKNNECMLS